MSWLVASMGMCDAWERLNGLAFEQGLATYKQARGLDGSLFEGIMKKIDENERAHPDTEFERNGDVKTECHDG